ncbi:MAG TPA: bifunctional oligoribonuclease/PAP phosphatase NrnA [Candidatus Limnocylindria bacterium]|nr:bifunctional oligoribonuclease/PAP phosphatase NrnA [Candidatus Limnocylindria bacterium]
MLDVADLLRGAERVTTFCHENPDGDTLGAAIAIALAAERLGKRAEVVSSDPPPPFLAFLPGAERVLRTPGLEPDVAVVVDAGELTRIGSVLTERADWFEKARIVNIDHHVSNPGYGVAAWIDPEAAATCEMVALLLRELGVGLDAQLATALLAGIVQDTHTFAHPNATPRTLRVAAELVEAGAQLSAINRAVYADKPFSTLALWGRMLAAVAQLADGRIVHASMSLAMLAATGEQPTAAEGFVDLLASTRAADLSILFKEVSAAETRVSIRTSARADAVAVASAFGGGGHARASGCTLQVGLDTARELVLAEAERELARGDARDR